MNVINIWMNLRNVSKKTVMQQDENLLHVNNGPQIDAIHMGYCQTGAVFTRRSGLLDIHPDRTPITSKIWIGF